MKTKNYPNPITVMLDERTKKELLDLSQNGLLSQGHVVRECIRARHLHTFGQRPTCADGGGCHCPNTHTYPPR